MRIRPNVGVYVSCSLLAAFALTGGVFVGLDGNVVQAVAMFAVAMLMIGSSWAYSVTLSPDAIEARLFFVVRRRIPFVEVTRWDRKLGTLGVSGTAKGALITVSGWMFSSSKMALIEEALTRAVPDARASRPVGTT